MVWHWYKIVLRIGSRRGLNKEELGYPRGSFQVLIDALEKAIEDKGGLILKGTTVKRIVVENNNAVGIEPADDDKTRTAMQIAGLTVNENGYIPFDRVYTSAPSFATLKIVSELTADYIERMNQAKYMAAVLVILKLKRQLTQCTGSILPIGSMPSFSDN